MSPKATSPASERQVEIYAGSHRLQGILAMPPAASGIVVFAHGSGSGRHSPRNQYVARVLQAGGLATLLIDLLAEDEAEVREKVFDIELLADRLQAAANWLRDETETRDLSLGFFGASTGAAAALVAAARHPAVVRAVVSRGGRPDLAEDCLRDVAAPTLLIVGSRDDVVVELNRQAYELLQCKKELSIVPGATHLFTEPGALEHVARLAQAWFCSHLAGRARDSRGSEDRKED